MSCANPVGQNTYKSYENRDLNVICNMKGWVGGKLNEDVERVGETTVLLISLTTMISEPKPKSLRTGWFECLLNRTGKCPFAGPRLACCCATKEPANAAEIKERAWSP